MPTLYRKRLIPEECVNLKDDDIVHIDKNMIITKWTDGNGNKNITVPMESHIMSSRKGLRSVSSSVLTILLPIYTAIL